MKKKIVIVETVFDLFYLIFVLSSAHIRADYVEVERLKQTKDVIVLRKEDIQGKGYKTLNDVLNSIPSINVGMSGYESIDIRGQGSAMAA